MYKTNKGFTLIELLGVVVLLAIIISIAFVNVINTLKRANNGIDSSTKTLIYNAAELTLKENEDIFPNDGVTTYCLTIKDLIDYGYLINNVKIENQNIKDTKAVLAEPDSVDNKNNYEAYGNGFGYTIVDKEECDD